MSEENRFQKKRIIDEPIIFPHLFKRVLNLDDFINSQKLKNNLWEHSLSLNDIWAKSIYKKLLIDPQIKESKLGINYNPQEMREIRNKYLKKLVESNPLYFPNELGLGEIKKQINTKEERINKLLKHLEEQAKKEKVNDSRKNSSILNINSRKESLFLENKRKRTESFVEEIDNKKNKKEKKEKEEKAENEEEKNIEEENGEVSYYEEHEEDYNQPDDDDSQNYNYSFGEGNDED